MTRTDLGFVVLGVLPVLLVAVVLWWFRRRRRDEMYVGVTPGERPAPGTGIRTRRLGGTGEWTGAVAVRFTPPDGVTPGIAGTVVDGRADQVDLSATIIDLAVRGHLTLTAVPGDGSTRAEDPDGPSRAVDWELERHREVRDGLRPFEAELLGELFAGGDRVRLSALRGSFGMTLRKTQIGLYREVVDHGWYVDHPQLRNRRLGCLGWPILLAGLALLGLLAVDLVTHRRYGPLELLPGLGLLVSGLLLVRGGRGRTPRTAEGTAVRVQTLGFREYLTTAEADQIRVEEARDVFSRYLPYAIVFGCADRWSRIFGEVAARAHLAGVADVAFDLDWIQGVDLLADVAHLGIDVVRVVDAFDGPGLVDVGAGLGDLVDGDLVETLSNGLGELASGVGDFVASSADLVDGLDGCDLDGCDL
ncbi:DUF2207 family protein [Arsenicicoccus dermatophilus]|uniref:DUF2207 family protein n=1 Tax=Arsenicicoccus dermatophilus TaxID=1076331 RepID=UPI0039173A6D